MKKESREGFYSWGENTYLAIGDLIAIGETHQNNANCVRKSINTEGLQNKV